MKDDKPEPVTAENLTMNTLSEFIHTKVGEASTLFYDNDDRVFNEQRALKISQELIDGVTRLVGEKAKLQKAVNLAKQYAKESGSNLHSDYLLDALEDTFNLEQGTLLR